jgi:hypothetical protein
MLAVEEQIEDHPLVSFLPLDLTSTDSLATVISHIDFTMQYGEDEEPKEVRRHFIMCSIGTLMLPSYSAL